MNLDQSLLEILACPACHSPLRVERLPDHPHDADPEELVCANADCRRVYPVHDDGRPGHRVLFSPHARSGIALLHDGDMIFELRDRHDLTRLRIERDSRGPFTDIDTPAQFAALELEGTGRTS